MQVTRTGPRAVEHEDGAWHISVMRTPGQRARRAARRTELEGRPSWRRTGNAFFPTAADVDGSWWVLRVNSFPGHPVWTLFVDGRRRYDVDDTPPGWGNPASPDHPALSSAEVTAALDGLTGLVAYGSEVGRPCNDLACCG